MEDVKIKIFKNYPYFFKLGTLFRNSNNLLNNFSYSTLSGYFSFIYVLKISFRYSYLTSIQSYYIKKHDKLPRFLILLSPTSYLMNPHHCCVIFNLLVIFFKSYLNSPYTRKGNSHVVLIPEKIISGTLSSSHPLSTNIL